MKLKDEQELWGTPIVALRDYSRKFRWLMSLLIACDMFVIFIVTYILFTLNISYQAYGFLVVFVSFGFHTTLYGFLKPERWETYRFFKKYDNCELETRRYKVTAQNLNSVLYCAGYRRLSGDLSLEDLKRLCYDACVQNSKMASRIMMYLDEYTDPKGTLVVQAIPTRGIAHFIKFIEEEVSDVTQS